MIPEDTVLSPVTPGGRDGTGRDRGWGEPSGILRSKIGTCYANMGGLRGRWVIIKSYCSSVSCDLVPWHEKQQRKIIVFTKDLVKLKVMSNSIKEYKSEIT